MIYFHSYKNPGLIVDIAGDIRALNNRAVHAPKTGMLVLGGGVVKHHVCNANLMVRCLFLTSLKSVKCLLTNILFI